MRLGPSEFFGRTIREHRRAGLLLSLSRYPPGLSQPWHTHANPTLFLLLCGQKCDRSPRQNHDQPPLTFVFHPTSEAHAVEVGPGGTLGLNIECSDSWLARHGLRERDLGGYRTLNSVWYRLRALELLSLAFRPERGAEAELETCLFELLELLVPAGRAAGPAPAPGWLRRGEEFLHDQFRSPITLRAVAREAYVHPVYFARVFRRRHGCSVSAYIRALRLAEAGRLIVQQRRPLAEAACAAGFFDQPHFSRCFSRQFGFSPKVLRRAGDSLGSCTF
jgi:AraC family transcriptional regulator